MKDLWLVKKWFYLEKAFVTTIKKKRDLFWSFTLSFSHFDWISLWWWWLSFFLLKDDCLTYLIILNVETCWAELEIFISAYALFDLIIIFYIYFFCLFSFFSFFWAKILFGEGIWPFWTASPKANQPNYAWFGCDASCMTFFLSIVGFKRTARKWFFIIYLWQLNICQTSP